MAAFDKIWQGKLYNLSARFERKFIVKDLFREKTISFFDDF